MVQYFDATVVSKLLQTLVHSQGPLPGWVELGPVLPADSFYGSQTPSLPGKMRLKFLDISGSNLSHISPRGEYFVSKNMVTLL